MRKEIKYSVSSFIIILSLMFGFIAYAEEDNNEEKDPISCTMEAKLCPDGVTYVGRGGPNCEFRACPGEKERIREDNYKKEKVKLGEEKREEEKKIREEKKEERKNEIELIKDENKEKREERRNEFESIINSAKEKREEFRIELDNKKEEIKLKAETIRANFKEDLKKVKDENKKIATEKIMSGVQLLNTKLTTNFSEKIEKIENVLVGIESRIAKAENRGLDVSSVKTMVEKAKESISVARDSISSQSAKVYEVNITGEETLKAEMKNLKEEFKKDIDTVKEKVKSAFTAVKNTAEALAKIPKIDDDDTNEVEDDNNLENQ